MAPVITTPIHNTLSPEKYCVVDPENRLKVYSTIDPSYNLEDLANSAYHLANDARNAHPIRQPLTELMEEYIIIDTNTDVCITYDLQGMYLWYTNHEPVSADDKRVTNPADNAAVYHFVPRDEYDPHEEVLDDYLDNTRLHIAHTANEPVTRRAVEAYLNATIDGGKVTTTHNYIFNFINEKTNGEGLAKHAYLSMYTKGRGNSTDKRLTFTFEVEQGTGYVNDMMGYFRRKGMLTYADIEVTFNVEDTENFDVETLAKVAWETFAKRFNFNPNEGDPYKAL